MTDEEAYADSRKVQSAQLDARTERESYAATWELVNWDVVSRHARPLSVACRPSGHHEPGS